MQQSCRRIRAIQASIAERAISEFRRVGLCSERTSCGIPSRRAWPKFRVVRQGQRWQEV